MVSYRDRNDLDFSQSTLYFTDSYYYQNKCRSRHPLRHAFILSIINHKDKQKIRMHFKKNKYVYKLS